MVNFLQSVRGLFGFVAFVLSVIMTFDGFPLALLSWLGAGVMMVGYTVAIATITHEDVGSGKEGSVARFIRICLAFAIASVGGAMVGWGGLLSVSFFDSITIGFRETAIITGIICGLFNIDKSWQSPAIQPMKEE